MNGLFVDSPELADGSLTQLSDDANSWPEEVIQKLRERLIQSDSLSMIVKFQKIDPEAGYATGAIEVSNSTNKVMVPVIIQDFSMYPLDVFIAKSKTLPLNNEYFQQAMGAESPFKSLEEFPAATQRFTEGNLMETIYPPNMGRATYASAGYPILDFISDDIDGSIIKETLSKNPTTLVGFAKNGHKDILTKLSSLKRPMSKRASAAGKIIVMAKTAPNKIDFISSNQEVFNPIIESSTACSPNDYQAIKAALGSQSVDSLLREGYAILRPSVTKDESFIVGGIDTSIVETKEPGIYSLNRYDNTLVDGLVINEVKTLDWQNAGTKMFLGKDGISSMQDTFVGKKIDGGFSPLFVNPKIGTTGVFFTMMDAGRPLCTTPFTVVAVSEGYDNFSCQLTLANLMGIKFHVAVSRDKSLQRIAKFGSQYVIPSTFKWVQITSLNDFDSSVVNAHEKRAHYQKFNNKVQIIGNGSSYSMRGVEKYASELNSDITNLQKFQVATILAGLGMGTEKIAEAIKLADVRGNVTIGNLKMVETGSDKAMLFSAGQAKLAATCDSLRSDLLKEASQLENSQTVDAMLALNFINPDTISKFVSKIPQLKAAASSLATLLLASRMGIQEVPENACSTAMTRLVEVINGLETLRASQEG